MDQISLHMCRPKKTSVLMYALFFVYCSVQKDNLFLSERLFSLDLQEKSPTN